MTINAKIVMKGGRPLVRSLTNIREGYTTRVVGPATRDLAIRIRDRARRTTSFRNRTGNLRRSIRAEQNRGIRGQYKVGWNVAAGNRQAFYATFVEFGTRFMRARNFLRDATIREGAVAKRVMAQRIRQRFGPFVRSSRV